MTKELKTVIDSCWNRIWSDGVSNPIHAIEIISIALLAIKVSAKSDTPPTDFTNWTPKSAALLLKNELGVDFIHVSESISSETFRFVLNEISKSNISLRKDGAGDALEYALGHLSTAGRFGQFRTPGHIASFMAQCLPISNSSVILDPSMGTAGFLIAAFEEFSDRNLKLLGDEIDPSMAQIGNANLAVHGTNYEVRRTNALENLTEEADFILANPPFAGKVTDKNSIALNSKSSKTEVLFLELISHRLRKNGWAAVILPISVLSNEDKHTSLMRQHLMRLGKVAAVLELPSGVFRPYTDVRTAILFWQKGSPTNDVIMWKVGSDGFTLDDRRKPIAENELVAIQSEVQGVLLGLDLLEKGLKVNIETIEDQDFCLLPSRYLSHQPTVRKTGDYDELMNSAETSLLEIISELRSLR
ncbi:HsdM Type I restriction-modification system methyltransferase subunit [Candidatus Nanopelagicaceae bacterium]